MIVEAAGPPLPEEITEDFLREACGIEEVHPDADVYLPLVLPGGQRVTMGFLGGGRVEEAKRATLVDVLWFLHGLHAANDPWISPAPEMQRCRILVTGEPGDVYPALVVERRHVGSGENQRIVYRRSLRVVTQPVPTDWAFSLIERH